MSQCDASDATADQAPVMPRVLKPCPGCKRNIAKSVHGSNRVTFAHCHTAFCWICYEKLEPKAETAHFSPFGFRDCSGRRFDDVDADGPLSLWTRFWRLYGAIHTRGLEKWAQGMHFVVYPLAVVVASVIWLAIMGVSRIRQDPSISSTPFSSLIENVRLVFTFVTGFAPIVLIYGLLPPNLMTLYFALTMIWYAVRC